MSQSTYTTCVVFVYFRVPMVQCYLTPPLLLVLLFDRLAARSNSDIHLWRNFKPKRLGHLHQVQLVYLVHRLEMMRCIRLQVRPVAVLGALMQPVVALD